MTIMARTIFTADNTLHIAQYFVGYSSERQSKGALQEQTVMLLAYGANATLVTTTLNSKSFQTETHDIHNLKHKMKYTGEKTLTQLITIKSFDNFSTTEIYNN